VPAAVLAERDVSIDQRRFDRRKFARPQVFLAEQFVNRPAPSAARNIPLASAHPSPLVAPGANKNRAGRAQRDELVRIHRHVRGRERPRIFQKIPRHPVIFTLPATFSTISPQCRR